MKQIIRHASLFSGIGAPELAAFWMGWQNVFHCEISEFCNTILNYWYPNSIGYENIKQADFSKWQGKIDVLTGGFPCQPFSSAGQRLGANDDRYLWPEMLRAIRQIQPSFVIGENVAGILSMVQPCEAVKVGCTTSLFGEDDDIYRKEQQFVVETVCTDLEREGYTVQPFVIPACSVGAPHQRDRVWFIARRNVPIYLADPSNTGTEGVRGRQTEVLSAGTATDPDCSRGDELGDKLQPEQSDGVRTDGEGTQWTLANSMRSGLQETRKELQAERIARNIPQMRLVADTMRERRYASHDVDGQPESSQETESGSEQLGGADCPQGWWRDFPTVSPVCRGNDGLPFDVSRLAIPFTQWRQESIKALGNSMVPQVVLELFRAIETEILEE